MEKVTRIVITPSARTKAAALKAQNLQGFIKNELANADPVEGEPLPESFTVVVRQTATRKQIERARDLYAAKSDDKIEIDDTADTALTGDGGIWVQAWVYLPKR
jgi:hypothetical protein